MLPSQDHRCVRQHRGVHLRDLPRRQLRFAQAADQLPSSFPYHKGPDYCELHITAKNSKTNGEYVFSEQIYLRIIDSKNFPKFPGSFKINDDDPVSFEPEGGPLEGQSFNINFDDDMALANSIFKFPVYKVEDGEMYLGLNIDLDEDFFKKSDGGDNVAEGLKEQLDEKLGLSKDESAEEPDEPSLEPKITLMGCLKFGFNDNKDIELTGAEGAIGFKLEFEKEKTVVVAGIPVKLGIEIEGGTEGTFKLDIDWLPDEDTNFNEPQLVKFDNKFELTASIEMKLSAGLGIGSCLRNIKGLSLGIYGSGGLEVTFNDDGENTWGCDSVKLEAEVGVYAEALVFEISTSLWDGEWYPYRRTKKTPFQPVGAGADADEIKLKTLDRTLASQPWLGNNASGNGTRTLLDRSLTDAHPQIIPFGDTAMMVYKGVNKDATLVSNAGALYCSIYDKNSGVWKEPFRVDNNSLADDGFDLLEINGRPVVVYSQAKQTYNENPTNVSDYAKDYEIYAATCPRAASAPSPTFQVPAATMRSSASRTAAKPPMSMRSTTTRRPIPSASPSS